MPALFYPSRYPVVHLQLPRNISSTLVYSSAVWAHYARGLPGWVPYHSFNSELCRLGFAFPVLPPFNYTYPTTCYGSRLLFDVTYWRLPRAGCCTTPITRHHHASLPSALLPSQQRHSGYPPGTSAPLFSAFFVPRTRTRLQPFHPCAHRERLRYAYTFSIPLPPPFPHPTTNRRRGAEPARTYVPSVTFKPTCETCVQRLKIYVCATFCAVSVPSRLLLRAGMTAFTLPVLPTVARRDVTFTFYAHTHTLRATGLLPTTLHYYPRLFYHLVVGFHLHHACLRRCAYTAATTPAFGLSRKHAAPLVRTRVPHPPYHRLPVPPAACYLAPRVALFSLPLLPCCCRRILLPIPAGYAFTVYSFSDWILFSSACRARTVAGEAWRSKEHWARLPGRRRAGALAACLARRSTPMTRLLLVWTRVRGQPRTPDGRRGTLPHLPIYCLCVLAHCNGRKGENGRIADFATAARWFRSAQQYQAA